MFDVLDLSLGDVHIVSLDDIRSRQHGKDVVSIIISVVCQRHCRHKITSVVVTPYDFLPNKDITVTFCCFCVSSAVRTVLETFCFEAVCLCVYL